MNLVTVIVSLFAALFASGSPPDPTPAPVGQVAAVGSNTAVLVVPPTPTAGLNLTWQWPVTPTPAPTPAAPHIVYCFVETVDGPGCAKPTPVVSVQPTPTQTPVKRTIAPTPTPALVTPPPVTPSPLTPGWVYDPSLHEQLPNWQGWVCVHSDRTVEPVAGDPLSTPIAQTCGKEVAP